MTDAKMTSTAELHRRYEDDGYAVVKRAAAPEVAKNLLGIIHASMTLKPGLLDTFLSEPRVNAMPAYEFYGYRLPAVMAFHWGLTSRISDIAGKELYSRKAKTIVQVGDAVTNNVLKPIGHTLEIVPLEHPYKLAGNTLSVQVLFKGKPLSNALIDAYSLVEHSAKEQAVKTDSEGKATFKFDVEGPVILNTVWGVPLTNSAAADFETYFSSLTFEYFQSPTK